jgi:hypothetical protein
LFASQAKHVNAIKSSYLYQAFDQTIQLQEIMQQQENNNISIKFQAALDKLRSVTLSKASWELLCTCVANQFSLDKILAFNNVLRLYYTTVKVWETNYNRLAATNQPIKQLTAEHKG